MAFAQGTVSGQIAFLQAFETFLSSTGWTIEYAGVARDNASDRQLMISHVRDTVRYYYSFVSRVTGTYDFMHYQPHLAINTGTSVIAQPSAPSNTDIGQISIPKTGSFEYFVYGDTQFINVVFRMGLFHIHMNFGQINLVGGYTKGILAHSSCGTANGSLSIFVYNYATASINHMVGNIGSWGRDAFLRNDGSWCWNGNALASTTTSLTYSSVSSNSTGGTTNWLPSYTIFPYPSESLYQNAASLLAPVFVYPGSIATMGKAVFAGTVPGIFAVAPQDHYSGKEIAIGTDTYQLFPSWNTSSTHGNSQAQGIAYEKVI